jgi:hypothetical protein
MLQELAPTVNAGTVKIQGLNSLLITKTFSDNFSMSAGYNVTFRK